MSCLVGWREGFFCDLKSHLLVGQIGLGEPSHITRCSNLEIRLEHVYKLTNFFRVFMQQHVLSEDVHYCAWAMKRLSDFAPCSVVSMISAINDDMLNGFKVVRTSSAVWDLSRIRKESY